MRQIAHGGDPFEMGSARPLDYGHWSAHKLEMLTRNALRHGEAVAIGIALDARYSCFRGLLPEGDDERVARLLGKLGFRLWDDALELRDETGRRRVLAGLAEFQEHLGGELTVTLLRRHRPWRRGPRNGRRQSSSGPSNGWRGGLVIVGVCATMRLGHVPGEVHLTYCTNIHAGETWGEIIESLKSPCAGDKGSRVSPDGRWDWVSGCRRSRPRSWRAGGSCGFPGLPRRPRSLRLHDQCLSLRALSRHAREGGRLPAGLAAARAVGFHRSGGRNPGCPVAGRWRRIDFDGAWNVQAARPASRGARENRSRTSCGTRRRSSTSAAAPVAKSSWRWSLSLAASWRPSRKR